MDMGSITWTILLLSEDKCTKILTTPILDAGGHRSGALKLRKGYLANITQPVQDWNLQLGTPKPHILSMMTNKNESQLSTPALSKVIIAIDIQQGLMIANYCAKFHHLSWHLISPTLFLKKLILPSPTAGELQGKRFAQGSTGRWQTCTDLRMWTIAQRQMMLV